MSYSIRALSQRDDDLPTEERKMTDDSRIADAQAELNRYLAEREISSDDRASLVARIVPRLVFDSQGNPRVVSNASGTQLFPVTLEDPHGLQALADELAAKVPAERKVGPTHKEQLEAVIAAQKKSGLYSF